MQFNEIFYKTDWDLFNNQKQALIRSIQILSENYPDEAENLEGLLNWIDFVQDLISENLTEQEVSKLYSFKKGD